MRIRLGTRASTLAQWQAQWVSARLGELGVEVLLVPISTSGDRRQRDPIAAVGSQGVFTKELQAALLDERIDLAVHSLKDLPTDPVVGLGLAAVPRRGPVGDVLVLPGPGSLAELPKRSIVGTGSLRRRAQLLWARNDLRVGETSAATSRPGWRSSPGAITTPWCWPRPVCAAWSWTGTSPR